MILIREMEKEDIDQIVDIEQSIFKETLGQDMLTNELHKDYLKFFVILCDNEIIGYLGSSIIDIEAEFYNFVIKEDYQHQGYGQKLFNYVIEYLINRDVEQIFLEVKANNEKGINFYRKNNFESINVRKHYYIDGTDAIVMKKVMK